MLDSSIYPQLCLPSWLGNGLVCQRDRGDEGEVVSFLWFLQSNYVLPLSSCAYLRIHSEPYVTSLAVGGVVESIRAAETLYLITVSVSGYKCDRPLLK